MLKINFDSSIHVCKDGRSLNTTIIRLSNKNGNYVEFEDFNFKLPNGVLNWETTIQNANIIKDDYGRYKLGNYVVSGKYTMSIDILLLQKEEI